MKNILMCILALGLLVSCSLELEEYQPSVLTPEEIVQVQKEVRDLLERNFQLINREGYTAELKTLHNSPDFYWIPPRRSIAISYDSVSKILHQFSFGNKSVECVWDDLHVQALKNDIASYTGWFHSTYIDTAGVISKFKMMEIGVAQKLNGEWKLVAGQTSVSPD